jgi:hypothetical protein
MTQPTSKFSNLGTPEMRKVLYETIGNSFAAHIQKKTNDVNKNIISRTVISCDPVSKLNECKDILPTTSYIKYANLLNPCKYTGDISDVCCKNNEPHYLLDENSIPVKIQNDDTSKKCIDLLYDNDTFKNGLKYYTDAKLKYDLQRANLEPICSTLSKTTCVIPKLDSIADKIEKVVNDATSALNNMDILNVTKLLTDTTAIAVELQNSETTKGITFENETTKLNEMITLLTDAVKYMNLKVGGVLTEAQKSSNKVYVQTARDNLNKANVLAGNVINLLRRPNKLCAVSTDKDGNSECVFTSCNACHRCLLLFYTENEIIKGSHYEDENLLRLIDSTKQNACFGSCSCDIEGIDTDLTVNFSTDTSLDNGDITDQDIKDIATDVRKQIEKAYPSSTNISSEITCKPNTNPSSILECKKAGGKEYSTCDSINFCCNVCKGTYTCTNTSDVKACACIPDDPPTPSTNDDPPSTNDDPTTPSTDVEPAKDVDILKSPKVELDCGGVTFDDAFADDPFNVAVVSIIVQIKITTIQQINQAVTALQEISVTGTGITLKSITSNATISSVLKDQAVFIRNIGIVLLVCLVLIVLILVYSSIVN